ncbi:MAG: zinc ribbon domain-containing protein [Verrucomicrobiales bacterium]
MLIPANQVAIAEALCPSCGHEVADGHRACASCGYGFEFATRLLPYDAPPLRKFIDYEGHLSRDDIKRGQQALDNLRTYFPQITLCTCLAKVPKEVSLSEFGFWFFNQSVPNSPRLTERRLHSILLCIDPGRGAASLTLGYGLDPFVDDESLGQCLAKVRKPLKAKNYGKVISKLCNTLRSVLDRGYADGSRAYSEAIVDRKYHHRQQALPPQRRRVDRKPPAPQETNV